MWKYFVYFGERVFGDKEGVVRDGNCIFVGGGICIFLLFLLILLIVFSNWWYEYVESFSWKGVVILLEIWIVGFFKFMGNFKWLIFLEWWLMISLNVVLWRMWEFEDFDELMIFLFVNDWLFDEKEVFFDDVSFVNE